MQALTSVDILINNVGAGVAPSGGYESITDEVWQRMLDVNFLGAVRLDRAFVPAMTERKWGVVIHIGVALLASERRAFACGVDYLMDGGVL